MKPRELANLGVPRGDVMKIAGAACAAAAGAGLDRATIRASIASLIVDPEAYAADPYFGVLSAAILETKAAQRLFVPREESAPWRQWGSDLESSAVDQLRNASEDPRAWNDSDSAAYEENLLTKVPEERIVSTVEAVARRAPAKINSFRYFVKEIVAVTDPRNRAWQKKQLAKIVRRIREIAVGRTDYSMGDFAEDVKRACAREAVPFDNDIFNELAG